jgi:hypothetical protein
LFRDCPTIVFSEKKYDELSNFRIYDGCYFIPSSKALDTKNGIIDISGSGVYKNKFITKSSDVYDIIHDLSSDSIGKNIRGSLSFYVINKVENKASIIADPLSGGIVFYFQSEAVTVFSNSINSINSILNALGIHLKKSMDYLNELVSTGNGGFFDSSYEEIKALKPFQYVEAWNHSFTIKDYSWKQQFFTPVTNYNEEIEKAVEEIKNNITAVSNYDNGAHKIAHLTGGFDSRLVLSSILNINASNDYHFFCSDQFELTDQLIAERLSTEYNLIMTEYPGYNTLKNPFTLEEEYLLPMQFSGGILSAGIHGNYEKTTNIILSGGYGECFRSFFGSRTTENNTNILSLLPKLWGNVFFNENDDDSLFSANFKNKLSKKIRHIFDEAKDNGIRQDAYLDYLYTRIRNRYYIGFQSHSWSEFASRFDPLYSLSAIRCALSLSQEQRSANIVGIDIMSQLYKDLTELPFDREIFNENYITYREKPNLREFRSIDKPKFGLTDLIYGKELNRNLVATPEQRDKAKRLKAHLWQVVEIKRVQQKTMELISSMPSSQVALLFNRKILYRLLKNDLNNRVHIRTVFSIYSILLWYFSKDK